MSGLPKALVVVAVVMFVLYELTKLQAKAPASTGNGTGNALLSGAGGPSGPGGWARQYLAFLRQQFYQAKVAAKFEGISGNEAASSHYNPVTGLPDGPSGAWPQAQIAFGQLFNPGTLGDGGPGTAGGPSLIMRH